MLKTEDRLNRIPDETYKKSHIQKLIKDISECDDLFDARLDKTRVFLAPLVQDVLECSELDGNGPSLGSFLIGLDKWSVL